MMPLQGIQEPQRGVTSVTSGKAGGEAAGGRAAGGEAAGGRAAGGEAAGGRAAMIAH